MKSLLISLIIIFLLTSSSFTKSLKRKHHSLNLRRPDENKAKDVIQKLENEVEKKAEKAKGEEKNELKDLKERLEKVKKEMEHDKSMKKAMEKIWASPDTTVQQKSDI